MNIEPIITFLNKEKETGFLLTQDRYGNSNADSQNVLVATGKNSKVFNIVGTLSEGKFTITLMDNPNPNFAKSVLMIAPEETSENEQLFLLNFVKSYRESINVRKQEYLSNFLTQG